MDDVKDKMKGFMKKVNNPFSSSSSGKFKGQGRVLGSSSSPSSSAPTNSILARPSPSNPNPKPPSSSLPQSSPIPSNSPHQNQQRSQNLNIQKPDGFDPFDAMISPSTAKRPKSGTSLGEILQCPVCMRSFRSEEEVSNHIDTCIDDNNNSASKQLDNVVVPKSEWESCVGAFVSGGASQGSIDIVLKLLGNVVKEPENVKFRRIRMSNPKIREAVGEVVGGVELLECVGFELQEEGGEMWAVMEVPSQERILLIKKAISLLQGGAAKSLPTIRDVASGVSASVEEPVEPQKIDRQVRVFFSVSESTAARIDLPDSFYNLSIDELKREADMRKKKIADSELLIPKSYKEKQAKAARKRYKNTVIRVQFPDGVVLQGIFLPWEPTTALYEFVSSSLKEPCLEFELWHPAVLKRRKIPQFRGAGERTPTLDDEDLVPAALVKFKPVETDSIVFTGLSNQLLELSEPLN